MIPDPLKFWSGIACGLVLVSPVWAALIWWLMKP
jgi:hypothetical protein